MKTIKIGIADSSNIILYGLKRLFEQNPLIQPSFACPDISSIFNELRKYNIDILLCDYVFKDDPLADGCSLLDKIKRLYPELKIVFFSGYSHPHIVLSTLQAGASGFIDKKEDTLIVEEGIKKAYANEVYLSPLISTKLINGMFLKKTQSISRLTRRELEVIRLVCDGISLSGIANRLNRSPKTISNQKNSAMRKLGATSDINLIEIMKGKFSEYEVV